MSCCSGSTSLTRRPRPHGVKACAECTTPKEGKSSQRHPRFCVTDCTEKEECVVCACAKHGTVVAPGVELKLPSVEGATYFWTICTPPYADCSLDCVQGQNCIARSPSLRGLEGATFATDGAYKEIKYVGYVVKHDEALLQKVFRVRVFDTSCQPCDYTITPSTCVVDESCPEVTVEYCGTNFGTFDPTDALSGVDFGVVENWSLSNVCGTDQEQTNGDAFAQVEVDVTKVCQGGPFRHRRIRVRLDELNPPLKEGRNELRFSLVPSVSEGDDFTLSFFLVKCPTPVPTPVPGP